MRVQELKTLIGSFPSEIKDSGIIQYRYSASLLQFSSILDVDSKTFLSQFDEDRLSIDFQRTRNSTIDEGEEDVPAKARRFYRVGELDIVAGCLFSRTTKWEFIFCNSNTLPLHPRFPGRYSNNLKIDPEKWTKHLM